MACRRRFLSHVLAVRRVGNKFTSGRPERLIYNRRRKTGDELQPAALGALSTPQLAVSVSATRSQQTPPSTLTDGDCSEPHQLARSSHGSRAAQLSRFSVHRTSGTGCDGRRKLADLSPSTAAARPAGLSALVLTVMVAVVGGGAERSMQVTSDGDGRVDDLYGDDRWK